MAAISVRTCLRRGVSLTETLMKTYCRRVQLARALCSTNTGDDVPGFADESVQNILKRITGMDFEKVFKPAKTKLKPPKYKLVSEERLQELLQEAKEKAEKKLQMPPVMDERNEIDTVLSDDHELAGLNSTNIVFTDISYGVTDRERFVVVREPSGVLRKANWSERARMLEVYFPREGRKLEMPPLFEDENLDIVFSQGRFEDLLNHCCVQFEPDDPNFIRVHQRTYENIAKGNRYDHLRSTRHFGGMAYYFTKRKRIDGLLKDMIQRDLIDDAVDLVTLYHMLHPQCASAREVKKFDLKGIDIVKTFIQMDAENGPVLELAVQAYENEKQTQTDLPLSDRST
ncbi:small ribosomal subunit protein mS22-like [Ptychodera flava]|uniref:small ribosomal subunit protein mS22-like n=1 Tax=Ptychodera flava TaxID=63121 RepID=UPI00396A0B2D